MGGLRRTVTWLIRGLLLVLLTVLALMNAEQVTLRVIGQHWQMPLAVALLAATVFGVVITYLVMLKHFFALRREIASLKRQLALKESPPFTAASAAVPTDLDAEGARPMER